MLRKAAVTQQEGCSARCPGTCLALKLAKTGQPLPPGQMMAGQAAGHPAQEPAPSADGTAKVMEGLKSAQVLALGAVMVSQALGVLAVRAAVQEAAPAARKARAAVSQVQVRAAAWRRRPCSQAADLAES